MRRLFFGQCNSRFGTINNNLQWHYLQLKLSIWQLVEPLEKQRGYEIC
jgi:hypothetical protein